MRTTIAIYRQLDQYLNYTDTAYTTSMHSSKPLCDPDIDPHFRSGVYLGVGVCNMILSLMPGKLMTLVELFGYKGDRKVGLESLMKAGGWVEGSDEPQIGTGKLLFFFLSQNELTFFWNKAEEGVRRAICDMTLLIFHLVLSSFTFDGVDISVASKVLKWNLKRYPNGIYNLITFCIISNSQPILGVFFLFGAGRLSLCRSQPEQAIKYYSQAIHAQSQYRNLHHISFWEMAIAHLALWDVKSSLSCWTELEREGTVSETKVVPFRLTFIHFFSGRNRFIHMEWRFVCWRVNVMMMMKRM